MPDTSPLFYPDEVFADALSWGTYKIVGLGEATHGTREFCELKHRLFKCLVENYDYRTE